MASKLSFLRDVCAFLPVSSLLGPLLFRQISSLPCVNPPKGSYLNDVRTEGGGGVDELPNFGDEQY